jgi:hypothetical protein
MAPNMDNEAQCVCYSAERTVTDNHIQQRYAPPKGKNLVESEGEYHTVENGHASPY